MKSLKSVLLLLGSAIVPLMFTGCASMMCGTKQNVALDSKPTGAEVIIYNNHGEVVYKGTTPCVASLTRTTPEAERSNYVMLIRKQGFAPVQIPLKSEMNRAYLANIAFGGVGLVVDPATGGMWTLCPEGVDPKVLSQNVASLTQENGLLVTLKEEVQGAIAANKLEDFEP